MKSSFKDFVKELRFQRPDGEIVPLTLTKQQEDFVDFLQWCKDNGYQTSIPYGCRGGKELFSNLWEKYNKEKEI